MCTHHPRCPEAVAPDRAAARVSVGHPEQGWSLLCNGVVLFDDAGTLLPGGGSGDIGSGSGDIGSEGGRAAPSLLAVA